MFDQSFRIAISAARDNAGDIVSTVENSTIVIVGTGPAGLAAALAVAQLGQPVTIVGPEPRLDDCRTTALMRPAIDFLNGLGIGEALREISAPLVTMRIADATNRLIRSPTVSFHANEINEDFFGLNIPNAGLNRILGDAVAASPLVAWHRQLVRRWAPAADHVRITLDDGCVISAKLAVAADGRHSLAREAAGISVRTKSLPQSALVLNFAHERHHGFVSTELHTEYGPCTQVPLPGGYRSSLVWVMRPADAARLAAADDASVSQQLEERQQSFLGKVTVEPGRQVYPLTFIQPTSFAARRIALVGEAAHVFPPITAQGLNLGIRDVRDIVDVIARFHQDPGNEMAMSAFNRKRRPDILARSNAVNIVNSTLLSSFLPAQLVRSLGLTMLDSVPVLRAFFMREGMSPGSGFSALLPARLRRMAS